MRPWSGDRFKRLARWALRGSEFRYAVGAAAAGAGAGDNGGPAAGSERGRQAQGEGVVRSFLAVHSLPSDWPFSRRRPLGEADAAIRWCRAGARCVGRELRVLVVAAGGRTPSIAAPRAGLRRSLLASPSSIPPFPSCRRVDGEDPSAAPPPGARLPTGNRRGQSAVRESFVMRRDAS
jgi:hypothetical protein